MGRYVLRRHIAAPPDRVFQRFTDPTVVRDWMDMSEIRDASGPLDKPGTLLTLVVRGPHRFRALVLASDAPRRHEMVGKGLFGSFHQVASFSSRADGTTDLALEVDYSLALGPIGRLLDRVFIDKEPRTIANRELDRFVELASAT